MIIRKIVEEGSKTFLRELAEQLVAEGASTLLNATIEAVVEVLKTKKLKEIEMERDNNDS